jgi:hypothetical protein
MPDPAVNQFGDPVSAASAPAPAAAVNQFGDPVSQPAPAAQAKPTIGSTFWNDIGGPLISNIVKTAFTGDQTAADGVTAGVKGVINGLKGEPARVWSQLSQTGQAMLAGHLADATYHLAGAVPIVGAGAQRVADTAAQGNYEQAAEHAAALILPFAVGGAGNVDAAVDASVNAAKFAGAAVKAGGPKVVGGAALAGAGALAAHLTEGIPAVPWLVGSRSVWKGTGMMGEGLKAGMEAGKAAIADAVPKAAEAAPEGAVATAPVSTPLPLQPEEGTPSPAPGTPVPMNRPLATTGTPSGYIPGEPPEVTAMRARLNGNGSAPTAPPPAPSTQNPAPYVAPDVPGALPGEPPAVTAMRQRLNGNGNGSAAPAPDSQAQAQLLDDIAKGQLGPKASFAKLSADQQDVVRRIAASMDPTPKAAGAVSRTVEPSGTVPAPSPAPSTQDPAPATVYPNVGKTQPGYEDTLGPGLNVFRVPIGDVIPTENPYGLGKGGKVAEYGARIQNGETPPPLYGRYDPTKGGVVLGDGNTRLEALRNAGAQTVDVATSNPKGFEAPAPAAQPTPEQMASVFQPESPRSAYTAAGVRKSPELRAAEIINAHQDARAVKIADYMVANKVDPQMADFQTLGAAANAENPSPTTIGKALTLWKNGTTRAQTPHWHTGHMPRTTQQ